MIQLRGNGVEAVFHGELKCRCYGTARRLRVDGSKLAAASPCGACTVHVNGQATRSLCNSDVRGRGGEKKSRRSKASRQGWDCIQFRKLNWIADQRAQCGYARWGAVMAGGGGYVNSKKKPADQKIDEAMSGNICRWETYAYSRAIFKEQGRLK